MRRPLSLLLALTLAAPLGGCVVDWTGRSGSYLLRSTIDATRERARDLEVDLVTERTRVDAMEERAADARRRYADSGATVQALMEDLTYLKGQLDDIQNTLAEQGKLTEDVQFQLTLVEARLFHIEGQLVERVDGYEMAPLRMPEEEPLPEEPPPGDDGAGLQEPPVDGTDGVALPAPEGDEPAAGVPVAEHEVSEEERTFRAALALVEQGEWERAGGRLQDFLHDWPDSDWYLEGQYMVGHCLYELGRYKGAITEYQRVIVRDDKSEWAARAMYMQGMSFEQLGTSEDFDAAEVFYSELVRLYPRSDEADRARERLDALSRR